LVWIATDPVLHADLHRARRQQLLKAVQPDLTRGERVIGDERRFLGKDHGNVRLFEGPAVERAEVPLDRRRRPFGRAEALLATEVEGEGGFQLVVAGPQEARDAAEVIVVTVAQHQSVECRRINTQKVDVVEERL
jgi:hypothetical protein